MKLQMTQIFTPICHNVDSLCSFLQLPQILIFPFPLAIEQAAILTWAKKMKSDSTTATTATTTTTATHAKVFFFFILLKD